MKSERLFLPGNDRVHLTTYLHDRSAMLPRWHDRPAVVVLPGGGYRIISDTEAEPVALAFMAQGFHAFVLHYSVDDRARFPNPLRDISWALSQIRLNAVDWGVRPTQIAVCGFSAGGHLAAALGTLWNDPEIQGAAGVLADENKPNALIVGYPVISTVEHGEEVWTTNQVGGETDLSHLEKLSPDLHVGPHTPPTFLFHGYRDELVPVENSLVFAQALARADIPFELHVFEHGSHGFSLANQLTNHTAQYKAGVNVDRWFEMSTAWLWRLFNGPDPGEVTAGGRAHFGDVSHSEGERFADTGRFTLHTMVGDLIDDPRARAVLQRHLPEVTDRAATGPGRDFALLTILPFLDNPPDETTTAAVGEELALITSSTPVL